MPSCKTRFVSYSGWETPLTFRCWSRAGFPHRSGAGRIQIVRGRQVEMVLTCAEIISEADLPPASMQDGFL